MSSRIVKAFGFADPLTGELKDMPAVPPQAPEVPVETQAAGDPPVTTDGDSDVVGGGSRPTDPPKTETPQP